MSIIRVQDTLVQELPKTILDALKTGQGSGIDTKAFETKKANEAVTFRSLIDRIFPVLTIIDYNDIIEELDHYSESELPKEAKQILLKAIKDGIVKSKSNVTAISSNSLQSLMSIIINNSALSISQKVTELKKLYSKAYYLTDSNAISPNSDIFISANFSAVGTRINDKINDELKKVGVDFRLGKYLDVGHSAAKIGETKEYVFNSPKLMSVLFDVATTSPTNFVSHSVDLNKATIIYANNTEQLKYSVTVDKDFGNNFLKMFVEFGGSIAVLENSRLNQLRGSTLEAKEKLGKNAVSMKKLLAQFKTIKDTAVRGLYNSNDLGRIIRNLFKYANSPSAINYLLSNYVTLLQTGKPLPEYKQSKSATSSVKITEKIPIVTGIAKNAKKSKPKLKIKFDKQISNLISIQNLINQSLHDQIKKNMGKGERTDVLNYRTGRFARSAEVTRLTSSREGAITAFYTYMKNPYATFSEGGQQSRPRSRDPKLLISKSIREIAATKIANRLRAVVV